MNKIIGHFKTITTHKWVVMKECFKIGLYKQGLLHDMSKYGFTEFIQGCKNYQGTASPHLKERQKKGYSSAWLHHKGRNKHHFEYWTDYSVALRKVVPVKMPLRYVAEMFCDRVAASKIYNGENYDQHASIEYFNRGKGRRIIHPETSDLLEELLIMLSEKGESYTFAHIRRLVKEEKGKA